MEGVLGTGFWGLISVEGHLRLRYISYTEMNRSSLRIALGAVVGDCWGLWRWQALVGRG